MQPIRTTTVNPQFAYPNIAVHVPDPNMTHLYQVPVPGPAAMPLYDYNVNSEQAMQRVPWTEIQNSMAMAAYYNDVTMRRDHQAMSGGGLINPAREFGHIGSASSMAGARSNDDFMMYCFKIQQCPTTRGHHDWTDCPYLHQGEKARRRDPRKCLYSGKPCAEFRKRGQCEHGDRCQFAHGVFETWLHPDKYKTQMCRDLGKCQRKVCFFAHSPEERREGDGVIDDMPDSETPKSILSMDKSPPQSPSLDQKTEYVMKAMERLKLIANQDDDHDHEDTVTNGASDTAESTGTGTRRPVLYPKFSFFEHIQEETNDDQYEDQEASQVDWIIANLLDSWND